MDHQLIAGTPADIESRSEKERQAYQFLNDLGINCSYVDHDVATNMTAVEEMDKALDLPLCKNLFLRNNNKSQYYIVMLPGEKQANLKELQKQIESSRLSFGNEDALMEYMNLEAGSVTIMGLMYDKIGKVRLLIDEDMKNLDRFVCHPCVNTSSIVMSMDDCMNKLIPALEHPVTYIHL